MALGKTLYEIESMSSREYDEWRRYEQAEPFGQPWDNWLMAVQGQMFASAHTAKGKSPPQIKDFFYKGPDDRKVEADTKADIFVNFLEGKTNGD